MEEVEIWLPIIGLEEYYEVSNMGQVRSIDRYVKSGENRITLQKGKTIAQQEDNKGYLRVRLSKDNKKFTFKVHRLVGIHFIPNTENKPQINHTKGNKKDNRWFMLEWSTNGENQIHSYTELGKSNIFKGKNLPYSTIQKVVIQCSLDGFPINVFPSLRIAQKETGIPRKHIADCLSLKKESAGNYLWL